MLDYLLQSGWDCVLVPLVGRFVLVNTYKKMPLPMDVILSSLNPWGGLQKGIVSALTVFTVSSFVRLCVYLRRPFSLLFVCHGDLCFINRVGTSNLQQILEFFIIYFEGSIYIVPFILCEKRNIVLSLCLDGKSKSSGSRFLCVCFFEYFVLREKRSAIILLISFSLLS